MTPLAGCRVLDLGIITAGAATSALLADLGAEVIKIESATYPDPFREWSSEPAPTPDDDLPPYFRITNRNKLNLGLDLKRPEGRDIFLRLAASSDVVVENFSRGVLTRLGIDYPALRAARPEIILASISSQGETGPDAAYVSFGSTLEAVGGLAAGTGYAGGPPVVTGSALNYPDQVVALFAAGMIVAAWSARQRDGTGTHLDLSQRELTSFLSGEAFQSRSRAPHGNAQAPYAIQDCVVCQDGAWIAASLTDAELPPLTAMLGVTADAVPAALTAWAATQPAAQAIAVLRQAGLTVAAVLDATGVLDGMGTDWADALHRLPDGDLVKGVPFRWDGHTPAPARRARALGADSIDVLHRVGGLTEHEIAALIGTGAVFCRP